MHTKTIALASNTSWFLYNFHLSLIKELQKEGYRVVVIAPKDDFSSKLAKEGVHFIPIHINSKGTNPLEDLLLIRSFYRIYQSSGADIILNFTIKPNIYGSIAAGFLKVPVISTITGLGTLFLRDGLSSRIGKLLYKKALKIPHSVYYLNQTDQRLFIDAGLVSEKKAEVIPGAGIDTVRFAPLSSSYTDKQVRFLLIARLIRDKGIIEYIDAARKLKQKGLEIECTILGSYYEGNPTAITPSEIAHWEREGIIRYLGTSENVPSVIADADCIVLPSYREGISQVLLEAASMAKPIIASDVPGCREVVTNGVNGYLCKAKDSNSLADTMQRMAALSAKERASMGKEGRAKVIREFEENVVNARYLEKINTLLH